MTDVVVVGDVMVDVVVRPSGPLAHGTDRLAAIETRPGGSAANIACWLAACGVSVTLAGRVGAGDHAAQIADLSGHGVVPHLIGDAARGTGTVVALIDADGERSFFTDRGANDGLCAADLPASLLDGARLLHVSGHAILRGWEAVRGLVAQAHARGVPVSVDAGSAGWLAGSEAAFLERIEGCALCFANEAEAALLWPEGVPSLPDGTVAVTHWAGCRAYHSGSLTVMRVRTEPAVDTVGAGDAFAAGYLARWLRGSDVGACLGKATDTAQRAVRQIGGRPTHPARPYVRP